MMQRFYSNGKLLLTGEYLVLDGAKALALPTASGQDLVVADGPKGIIRWKSIDIDGTTWFEDEISFSDIEKVPGRDAPESIISTLISILHQATLIDKTMLGNAGYSIETRLTFPRKWGLGTSSTLINNIAQWRKIDAFDLLYNSFGGSGYDIACAQHDSPLLFHLESGRPKVEMVAFLPEFRDHLYFVYLNRKQSSKAAIASYYNNRLNDLADNITAIDSLTEKVLNAPNVGVFARAIENHESIMSGILEMKTAQETFFPDFDGVIKSLGGWGGDFVLAVSHQNPTAYFQEKGFATVIPYNDLILSAPL